MEYVIIFGICVIAFAALLFTPAKKCRHCGSSYTVSLGTSSGATYCNNCRRVF